MKRKNIHKHFRQNKRSEIQEAIEIDAKVKADIQADDFSKDMDFLDEVVFAGMIPEEYRLVPY